MRSSFRSALLALLVVLLALVLPATAVATISTGDGVWKWQNPLPQGNSINDACFVDAQTGWVVGDNGTVIHTGDGGVSWTAQRSGTTFDLVSVSFADAQHGWAVGNDWPGVTWTPYPQGLIATADGGATWHAQDMGIQDENERSWIDYKSVMFVDSLRGWVIGTYHYKTLILATVDGGRTWQRQEPVGESLEPSAVFFADPDHGWIVGRRYENTRQTILATSDGGEHWVAQEAPMLCPGGFGFRSVCFTDRQHGWIVGDTGLAAFTEDGGATWKDLDLGTFVRVNDVHFSDQAHGLILFSDGELRRTVDGGASWSSIAVGAQDVVMKVLAFGDASSGWAMGVKYSPYPENAAVSCHLSKTTDGGATWATPPSSITADLKDVTFVSRTQGWAAGEDGTIMVTTDGGETWTAQAPPITGGLNSVDFTDSLSGWAVGDGGAVVATVDGGTTWHSQPSATNVDLRAVTFIDAKHGFAVGADTFLRTSDGGFTWTAIQVPCAKAAPDLESVSFVDAAHGWIGGGFPALSTVNGPPGCVFATSDGGATWSLQHEDYEEVTGVWFTDAQYGWACHEQRILYRTTDGGETWENCDILSRRVGMTALQDVMFVDRMHGWSVGTDGIILATSDGMHWVDEDSGTTRVLSSVAFVDPGHGWVVGQGGLILEDPGPICRAPYKSVVRRGRIATLRCKVSDAAVVRVTVTIRVRDRLHRVVKRLVLRNRAPNKMLSARFRCRLARGTYHFYVDARDSAGNKAGAAAVNKLIVR